MIFIVDYIIPRTEEVDSLIVEADKLAMAERKAIDELKALKIPKRYILNIEGAL